MAGAGCISDEDFGVRGINVADQGSGRHVKIADSGVYNGGVGYSVWGVGWRRSVTAARISRRNKVLSLSLQLLAMPTVLRRQVIKESQPLLVVAPGPAGFLRVAVLTWPGFLEPQLELE